MDKTIKVDYITPTASSQLHEESSSSAHENLILVVTPASGLKSPLKVMKKWIRQSK